MARSRNIKPSFFMNEDIIELPFEARLLFIGLWILADREGRLENRPKKIKMSLFPADDINVAEQLENISKFGFIELYNADGIDVIQIVNFVKHQNPHGLEIVNYQTVMVSILCTIVIPKQNDCRKANSVK